MLLSPTELQQAQQDVLRTELLKLQSRLLKPKSRRTLSEFSENEIYLSAESSRLPGKFSFANAEFQREVFDSLSDQSVRKVVVCAASQILKTQSLLNYIAYSIIEDPSPILIVQPDNGMASAFARERINPMLRDTPILWGRINKVDLDDESDAVVNRVMSKSFAGGALNVVSAGSPASLASRPIKVLLMDEVDRYPMTSEGDPISIAQARTSTFSDISKTVLVSSPTDEASRIWAEFQASDQRYYFIKCPHCDHEQKLVWSQVRWTDGQPETALYHCEDCGVGLTDFERNAAVARGRWIASADSDVVGFHLNALYSSWRSLSDIVAEWLQKKQDPEQLRAFLNTRLAEVWRNSAASLDDMDFLSRIGDYTHESIPNGCLVVTAGVDVQADRVEMETVAWGLGDESWSLEYMVFHGQPTLPKVWDEVKEFLKKKYIRKDGVVLPISATCIDSGHATQDVYRFCGTNKSLNALAVKGVQGSRPLFPTKASAVGNGYRLYPLGVDTGKTRLYDLLKVQNVGPGFCHFPSDRDEPEYYKGLTAEKFETKYHKGKKTLRWVLPSGRRNEPLDCRVYAMAARASLRYDLHKRKAKLDKQAGTPVLASDDPIVVPDAPDEVTPQETINTPKRNSFVRPRSSGWMNKFR